METPLSLGRLGQVSLLCRSAPETERWYRDTLGLTHLYSYGQLVFFDCAGTRLFVREVAPAEWRASSTLYFSVADIKTATDQLKGRGIHFQGEPHMLYRDDATGIEEWFSFFEDPDGNTLALLARVPSRG